MSGQMRRGRQLARPRKNKPRTKSGQIKRAHMDKTNTKPTDELTRHKKRANGGEIGDPLSYLALTDAQKKALDKFATLAKQAGFSVGLKTSSLSQMIGGSSPDHISEPDRDRAKWVEYQSARQALRVAGPLQEAVVDQILARNRVDMDQAYLSALKSGADTLARHFGFAK